MKLGNVIPDIYTLTVTVSVRLFNGETISCAIEYFVVLYKNEKNNSCNILSGYLLQNNTYHPEEH